MLVLSKHPTEWKSYPMMKDVFDKIVDSKTLIVDTLWSTFAEHKDNIDRWLAKEYEKYPDELPEELKIFLPIQDIKNRHTCIKMPFEAFFKSIKN